jgi:hypothetical protein
MGFYTNDKSRRNAFLLRVAGLTLPVTISHASLFTQTRPELAGKALSMAHLDTGASRTSIDVGIARKLKLIQVGDTYITTAGGIIKSPTFLIDIYFPNTTLSPFINLEISSCNLHVINDVSPPFDILLGRDILARWNIVWNGATSTVFIND